MGWLWILIMAIPAGAVIGFIARAIVPGKQDLSIPITIGLGIAGMLLGSILGKVITPDNSGVPFIAGTISAVLILFGGVKTGMIDQFTKK